jgi:hypothetical protein
MATWNPAQEINRPQLGNLDAGSEADIAVLRLEDGRFGFADSAGARKSGTRRVLCEMTLRKGQVVWDLDGLASPDWEKFPYRKGSVSEAPYALVGQDRILQAGSQQFSTGLLLLSGPLQEAGLRTGLQGTVLPYALEKAGLLISSLNPQRFASPKRRSSYQTGASY